MLLATLIAWFAFGQTLDGPARLGLALIVAGVIVPERILQVINPLTYHSS